MLDTYKTLFGNEPTKASSRLEKNDHPKLDDSPELLPNDASKYQSMISAGQWLILLGCFDIAATVTMLSQFRAVPWTGHLE